MKIVLVFLLAIFSLNSAFSADLCRAIALRDVAAVESPDSILQKGEYDEAITQYRVNNHTGMTSFCSHGGYCYPTHVYISGKRVEALKLTNCKIGKVSDYNDFPDETFYVIDVDRLKNSPKDLRFDDVENKFLEMGLCSACADNVAQFYIKEPKSRCAKLAKQALEGNPEATEKLLNSPDYCNYKY
jgi:hypothetical protein